MELLTVRYLLSDNIFVAAVPLRYSCNIFENYIYWWHFPLDVPLYYLTLNKNSLYLDC